MLRFTLTTLLLLCGASALAAATTGCPRPAPGATVSEPVDLRSTGGVLNVDLYARNSAGGKVAPRYCYQLADGSPSPTLRRFFSPRTRSTLRAWPVAPL